MYNSKQFINFVSLPYKQCITIIIQNIPALCAFLSRYGSHMERDNFFKNNLMSTEMVKTSIMSVSEIMSIGKAFAESGMFADIKSAAQAVVKIQAGQELGIPPFASMSGIHIIQGKPTVGAGLMATRVKGSGKYNYKVVEQTDIKCSLDFYEGKEMIGNSTFTIEDAKKAGTKNIDKFPKNMLFARAISNGVKWYAPDVFASAVYTPEEMGAENAPVEDIPHDEIKELPILTTEDKKWDGIVKALASGSRTMEQLKEKYQVSEEVETLLINIINTPA